MGSVHRVLLVCLAVTAAGRAQSPGVAVVVEGPGDAVERFAGGELTRYLRTMTSGAAASHTIRLGADCRGEACNATADGFRIHRKGAETIIRGSNSRGVLYGAYALLEHLGVRWFGPGPDHEYVPRRAVDWNAPLELSESAAIRERILFYWPSHYQPVEEWIDFAAKARLNRFCFLYGWPTLDWYTSLRAKLVPELRKRGMVIEVGGHLLTAFLPKSLFQTSPDWFRKNEKGERVADWNLNAFSRPALDYLSERLAEYFARMPEATMFHAWPDDIEGRGWSSDPESREYSPSDQSLLVSNAVVTALRRRMPEAQLPFLAYHDTVEPPRRVKPAAGILYFWAPRERCYAHGLDDARCGLNAQYRKAFEAALPVFGASQTEIFEYYVDQVLFENMANPPLGDVLSADARYYARSGVPRVGSLAVNTAEWVTPPVNLFLYPQALWNPSRDLGKTIDDYAATWFGDRRMQEYFRELGAGMREMIAICEYAHPGDAWDRVQPDRESDEALESHVRGLERALTGPLERASAILNSVLARAEGPRVRKRLEAERRSLDYTRLQGRLYYHMLKGQWLLQVHDHRHDREAGLTAAAESSLARYSWEKLKAFIATSGLRGEPLLPDPEIFARRARSFARANGCTIDNLGHLMMNGIIGYTVNGPGGSRAVLWADRPGVVLRSKGLDWRDEFGRSLKTAPDADRWPAVIYSPHPIDRVMKTIMAGDAE